MIMKLDVIVMGAGSVGLVAVRQIKKKSDNFILINHGTNGATCGRVSCMPSEALD